MPIWDLFSKREARKRKQGQEDVFQYDDLPEAFRAQVIHVWRDVLGNWHDFDRDFGPRIHHYPPNEWWLGIFKIITRENGVFALSERREDPNAQCLYYMMNAPTADALDLIEVSFTYVNTVLRSVDHYDRQRFQLSHPDRAIEELNGRFREHCIGYEFAGGEIVRVDSKYIHAEAVKPALSLLHGAGKGFLGPLQEFLHAHEHYRKGERKDAIVWACKAFESTLKAILRRHESCSIILIGE